MTILHDQVIENPLKVRENPAYVQLDRKYPIFCREFLLFKFGVSCNFCNKKFGKLHTHTAGFEPTISPYIIFVKEESII